MQGLEVDEVAHNGSLFSGIGDALGENVVELLGARVGRKVRHAAHCSNGGSVGDCVLVTVTVLLGYEVKKRVLGQQHVGMNVCLDHCLEEGGVCLEEHLVFHDSSVVDDDAGPFRFAEKTRVLTRGS